MHSSPAELLVVMPAFNEGASVAGVIREWFLKLDSLGINFIFLAIDDGSTDSTHEILLQLRSELGGRLEVLSQQNRGHGQTCMRGYRTALERSIPYVFQIDSDGQSDPQYFSQFWEARLGYDVIYGNRRRFDGIRRIIASQALRLLLRFVAGVDCVDANVPYRLMRTEACKDSILRVPADLFLANVGLAVMLRDTPDLEHGSIPIGFPPRRGGEPSVPFAKFAGKALELVQQLRRAGIC